MFVAKMLANYDRIVNSEEIEILCIMLNIEIINKKLNHQRDS